MSWEVKYNQNNPVAPLLFSCANHAPIPTKILYNNEIDSDVPSQTAALIAKAKEIGAGITPSMCKTSFDSDHQSSDNLYYDGLSIFQKTLLAGAYYASSINNELANPNQTTIITCCSNVIAETSRSLRNIFGYDQIQGGSLSPVRSSLYCAAQASSSRTFIGVYCVSRRIVPEAGRNWYQGVFAEFSDGTQAILSGGAFYASDETISAFDDMSGKDPNENDPLTPNNQAGEPGGPAWSGGGVDGSGGGFGDFDYSSATETDPSDPALQTSSAGFFTVHVSSDFSELNNLATYLWSNQFDIDNFKRIYADPMDCILGCNIIPATVPVSPATVKVGNISTTVSFPKATKNFVTEDLGTCFIPESKYTKTFLDYAPYTKCQLYLPYIGFVELSANEVIGRTLSIKYHIDIVTGAFVANVYSAGCLIGTYPGNCATSIPITSGQYAASFQTAAQVATTALAAAAVIGAFALAPEVAGPVAAAGSSIPLGTGIGGLSVQGAFSGAPVATAGMYGVAGAAGAGAGLSLGELASKGLAAKGLSDTASKGMRSVRDYLTPSVTRSGALSCASGYLNIKYAFLLITAPDCAIPSTYNEFHGRTTYDTLKLSSLKGFTQIAYIHLGTTGTDEEREEIMRLLSEGVML